MGWLVGYSRPDFLDGHSGIAERYSYIPHCPMATTIDRCEEASSAIPNDGDRPRSPCSTLSYNGDKGIQGNYGKLASLDYQALSS